MALGAIARLASMAETSVSYGVADAVAGPAVRDVSVGEVADAATGCAADDEDSPVPYAAFRIRITVF